MNRSTGATIARTGGRLVAVLLPVAALAIVLTFPPLQAPPLPWVAPAIASAAAVAAGFALLVAVAAGLEDGRLRDLADVAGLGMLATAFIVVALDATGSLGPTIGVASAAAAFTAGSIVRGRALRTRRGRVGGVVAAVVLAEGCLAALLLSPGWSVAEQTGLVVAVGAGVLLAVAAVAGLDEATRATALGVAATSALVLALADRSASQHLVGTAGMGFAALGLAWPLLRSRLGQPPMAGEAPALPALPGPTASEPEYDELSRISRELRATLDDLVAARHLIELQRVEIDRASSTDSLTGLSSRWRTLDRLRTEAAEARRYAHPVAVVLFDIDHFADLNHEHGLEVGDAILREIALRLRMRMREADAVGRIGADAFLAILPHTDEGGAATFAQAVLDRLLERRVMTDRGEMTVSVSIGIALMRPGMTLGGDELLASAEEALASARAAGGNRIAFDRLHGLARLDEHRDRPSAPQAPTATEDERTS